jgi:hypothetical protein
MVDSRSKRGPSGHHFDRATRFWPSGARPALSYATPLIASDINGAFGARQEIARQVESRSAVHLPRGPKEPASTLQRTSSNVQISFVDRRIRFADSKAAKASWNLSRASKATKSHSITLRHGARVSEDSQRFRVA